MKPHSKCSYRHLKGTKHHYNFIIIIIIIRSNTEGTLTLTLLYCWCWGGQASELLTPLTYYIILSLVGYARKVLTLEHLWLLLTQGSDSRTPVIVTHKVLTLEPQSLLHTEGAGSRSPHCYTQWADSRTSLIATHKVLNLERWEHC